MAELDPRVVRLGIEIGEQLKIYDGLALKASGTKYANALENEASVEVFNLDRATRDYLLTETSPYNHNPKRKRLILEAGRVSSGAYPIYSGDIVEARVSQPPDIGLSLKARTCAYLKGDLVANAMSTSDLSVLSGKVAKDLGLKLVFEAKDKKIANWSFSGGALAQVNQVGSAGRVDCYVDDDTLVVKDMSAPLENSTCVLSEETGMIGIPEISEHGVKVTMMLVPGIRLGSRLQLVSKLYSAINGEYAVYKLSFDIASRDTPFYWVAECRNTRQEFIKPGLGALLR
ncbi:MAG: hypothetical protein LBJ76_04230 [Candidatus Accumulibacter sp.]|jgi:hypothetical protein|nr:hypothetical protein [Accumulibacter sp.]